VLVQAAARQPDHVRRVVRQTALGLQLPREAGAVGAELHLAGHQHAADDHEQQHADADADLHQVTGGEQGHGGRDHRAADEQHHDHGEGGAQLAGHG